MSKLNKSKILDVVYRISLNEGLEKITISRISNELNSSKSSIYNHFKSKEEMLDELFLRIIKSIEFRIDSNKSFEYNVATLINFIINNADKYIYMEKYIYQKQTKNKLGQEMCTIMKKNEKMIKSFYMNMKKEKQINESISYEIFSSIIFGPCIFLSRYKLYNNMNIDKKNIDFMIDGIIKQLKGD